MEELPFGFTFGTESAELERCSPPASPFTTIEFLPFEATHQEPVPVDFRFGLVLVPEDVEEDRVQSAARTLAGVPPPSPPGSPFVMLELEYPREDHTEVVGAPKKRKLVEDEDKAPAKKPRLAPPPSVAHSDGSTRGRLLLPLRPAESLRAIEDADLRRKASHNAIEKRRRATAKAVMDELQSAVRTISGVARPSKTDILIAATHYIKQLEAQVLQLQTDRLDLLDPSGSFLPSTTHSH